MSTRRITIDKLLYVGLATAQVALFLFFLLRYIQADFPNVGHDYSYFIPRLIDTDLHYRINGPSIQWYTPSFGGGLPAYANPQHLQFTLTQLLVLLVDPWTAVLASLAIYIVLGFAGAYLLLVRVFELHPLAGILGAGGFIANGFLIQHAAVGHVTFQTFPLLSVMAWLLLDRRLASLAAALLLGVTGALLIHAGNLMIVLIAFSLALATPLAYLLRPASVRMLRIAGVAAGGVLIALLLSASKISAVLSLMSNFPRYTWDAYNPNLAEQFLGILAQIAGTTTLLPMLAVLGKSPYTLVARLGLWTGSPYSFWELDIAVSPAVLLLIAAGGIYTLMRPDWLRRLTKRQWLAFGGLAAATCILTEFILARGVIFSALRGFPIFASLRVYHRFTAALIFPLALCAAWVFHHVFLTPAQNGVKIRRSGWMAFSGFYLLMLAAPWGLSILPLRTQVRNYDIQPSLEVARQVRQSPQDSPVLTVYEDMNEHEVFLAEATTLRTDDPLLVAGFRSDLQPGPVWMEQNGFYNLHDPVSFVYPAETGTPPFSQMRVTDRDRMEAFIQRRQPDWLRPAYQRTADSISLISWLSCPMLLAYALLQPKKYLTKASNNWIIASNSGKGD